VSLGLTGALRHQLGHDSARRIHASVCEGSGIGLSCPFGNGTLHQLAVTLGKIGVARFS
jgi:hypothetical protein